MADRLLYLDPDSKLSLLATFLFQGGNMAEYAYAIGIGKAAGLVINLGTAILLLCLLATLAPSLLLDRERRAADALVD